MPHRSKRPRQPFSFSSIGTICFLLLIESILSTNCGAPLVSKVAQLSSCPNLVRKRLNRSENTSEGALPKRVIPLPIFIIPAKNSPPYRQSDRGNFRELLLPNND